MAEPPSQKEHNSESERSRTNDAIDASDLYQVLALKRIDSSVPGDAAASLRSLIQLLRKSIEYICECNEESFSFSHEDERRGNNNNDRDDRY